MKQFTCIKNGVIKNIGGSVLIKNWTFDVIDAPLSCQSSLAPYIYVGAETKEISSVISISQGST